MTRKEKVLKSLRARNPMDSSVPDSEDLGIVPTKGEIKHYLDEIFDDFVDVHTDEDGVSEIEFESADPHKGNRWSRHAFRGDSDVKALLIEYEAIKHRERTGNRPNKIITPTLKN
jgi:hypothetical protein